MTDKESDTGKFYTNYRFDYPKENVVVATSSFEEVPSNKKPLINLTVNGILRPSEEKVHEIKMIFDSDVPEKDYLSRSYGTFVLCKGVYNARKIVKTAWEKEKNTLTIIIDLRREKIRPRRPAQFSFSVQINDDPRCSTVRKGDFVSYTVYGTKLGTKVNLNSTFRFNGKAKGTTCPYGNVKSTYKENNITYARCGGDCKTNCQPRSAPCYLGQGTCCTGNCFSPSKDMKLKEGLGICAQLSNPYNF